MMTMTRDSRALRAVGRCVWISVAALCVASAPLTGQVVEVAGIGRAAYLPEGQNVPQDVRIMRTIVSTALSQVEAPALPKDLAGDSTENTVVLGGSGFVYSRLRGSGFLGSGDVSGFYMKGYGYLFTVQWPISSLYAFRTRDVDEAGVKRVAGMGVANSWAVEYRKLLTDALADVIAGYGSTLRRAAPGESITFIADFGGGDDAMVTMTAKADALRGSDVKANRSAIQISSGQGGVSERLRTQLKIMSEIIDTSLHPTDSSRQLYAAVSGTYFGGSAEAQYVPGYGVVFRKTARMNTARTFVTDLRTPSRRQAVDSLEQAARTNYREHLDTLRRRTVEILATYGPTLTELKDDDWVGIYYDVGSAAALLTGGMDDFLVQARMRDIRQAAGQSDPAAWLSTKLVTNEKQE